MERAGAPRLWGWATAGRGMGLGFAVSSNVPSGSNIPGQGSCEQPEKLRSQTAAHEDAPDLQGFALTIQVIRMNDNGTGERPTSELINQGSPHVRSPAVQVHDEGVKVTG